MSASPTNLWFMKNFKFPKTPVQAYRETAAEVVAYNAGVALRILWEVAKPILKWTAILAVLSFAWMIYLIWQLIFGTTKN